MALTPKQENFCLAYMETGNASEAYRRAYGPGNMSDKTIWEKASHMLAKDKVRARVEELQAELRERAMLTIDGLTEDLMRIARKGEDHGEPPGLSVARASLMDAAKLNGLIVDKKDLSSSDGTMTPKPVIDMSKVPDEALRALLAATIKP
jgi:phage terminase small subunit